jgi:hypothetical protein
MVIAQTLGRDWRNLVREADAKAKIQAIENDNKAIRDALVAKVGATATPGDRERALRELRNENPLFHDAIDRELVRMLQQNRPV